jgi:murein DD-endopeptidase MepM/ murein hydrolase activator NlpD
MKKLLLYSAGTILFVLACITAYQAGNDFSSAKQAVLMDKDKESVPHSPQTLYGVSLEGMQVSKAVFKTNENLSEVLQRYHIPVQTIFKIGQLPKDTFNVRRLKANKPYTVIHPVDSSQEGWTFVYHPNPIDYVALHLADSVSVVKGQHPVDTVYHSLAGVITTSLYESVLESGGSPVLVNELADVYAWEIDFFGLQAGDCYKVIYTTHEVKGKAAGFGKIVTAEFTHMGEERYAFLYDQGEGEEYFDEEGNSLRKTFLKAPLQFSRISSRFSYSRLHPILKIRRPHLGVDYAAPQGTPVHAVGDGVVIFKGYSGGAGKMIKIKHNGNYMTAYLHLNGYGKNLRKGSTVKQGDVIGYVGSTGLSTGPHLDFRFYKNGRAVDPLKVDPGSSTPILEEHKVAYFEQMQHYRNLLFEIKDDVTPILVAAYTVDQKEESAKIN